MPQKFINNFEVFTSFAIGPEGELGISDLLSGAPLARITDLLSVYGDWVELVLMGEAGEVENIRVDSELQRDYAGDGSGALAWPAGSRLIAPYSAASAAAAKAAARPILNTSGDVLALSPLGAWLWNPSFLTVPTIDNTLLRDGEGVGGDGVVPFAEVLLPSHDDTAPQVVKVALAPAFVKLPPGGIGVYDAELGSYEMTLPAGPYYRFRFGGIGYATTLDVSNYSEYQSIG